MILLRNTKTNQTYEQGDEILLTRTTNHFSTKPTVTTGSWYFESKHISGPGSALIGFVTSNGRIDFFQTFNNKPVINIIGSLRTDTTNDNQRISLSIDLPDQYTIGVGIDIDKSIFSVHYENTIYTCTYNKNIKLSYVNAEATGATDDKTNDIVTVNFGKFDFKYNFPGLIPWEQNIPKHFCTSLLNQQKLSFFF